MTIKVGQANVSNIVSSTFTTVVFLLPQIASGDLI